MTATPESGVSGAGSAGAAATTRAPARGRELGQREAQIQRIMARFVGGGYVAYLLVAIPEIAPTAQLVASWFTPVGLILSFAPGIVLLGYSFRRQFDPQTLLVLVYTCSAGYVLANLAWLLAWEHVAVGMERVTWLMNFSGLPSLAIVLARPIREALGHLVLGATVNAVIVRLGRVGEVDFDVVMLALWSVAFTAAYLLGVGMAVRTGRTLDRARAGAYRAVADTAAIAARDAERARFDALIHDRVIATLLAAVAAPGDMRLAGQASSALAELDGMGQPQPGDRFPRDEVIARIRAAVAVVDDAIAVLADSHAVAPEQSYPADAVRAVNEAVAEAVRNSVRHAGPGGSTVVHLDLATNEISAAIIDDGVGFDPDAVPAERLGIEVSIRQRMATIGGGSAQVHSVIGAGTTVRIGWRDE